MTDPLFRRPPQALPGAEYGRTRAARVALAHVTMAERIATANLRARKRLAWLKGTPTMHWPWPTKVWVSDYGCGPIVFEEIRA